VYVADLKNKVLEQYAPVLEGGALVGERFVRSTSVRAPSDVAVDNSGAASDPSAGDVYVVGNSGKAIYKFTAEGVPVGAPLHRFEISEAGVKSKTKFEGIEGIAVDSAGSLYVYEQGGTIFELDSAVANEGVLSMPDCVAGPAAGGLALSSAGNLFVGVVGEGGSPDVAELQGGSCSLLLASLGSESAAAVAVNRSNEPGNLVDERDDVYVARTLGEEGTVSQFAPDEGGAAEVLVQSFGNAQLKRPSGIAVDERTGTVYVGDATSAHVDVFELESAGAPSIDALTATSAASARPDAREVKAQIDANGARTSYGFEYGADPCATGECTKSQPTDIGDAFGDVEASLELGGLAPGTYHYRVLAESQFGTTISAERSFTIFALAEGLPDNRTWELVTPPDKHGAPVEALTREGGLILASEDGDAITYVADGAVTEEPQGNRSPEMQQVISVRGGSEWNSQDIATPQSAAQGIVAGHAPEYQSFSPDLSLALVEPPGAEPPLAASATAKEPLYVRANAPIAPGAAEQALYGQAAANGGFLAPGYLPLLTEATAPEARFPVSASFLSATPDLSAIVMRSLGQLAGPSSGAGLYELVEGHLRFVSELPGGGVAPEAQLGFFHVQAHALSADGSRVFWTDSQSRTGHLYMRDTTAEKTLQLDRAQGVVEPTTGEARFQTASSDGSRVFFTDTQPLTEGSTSEPNKRTADLYECEIVKQSEGLGCMLHDLTIPLGTGERTAVQGTLLGASEDGSHIYVVARARLASNENATGAIAQTGANNLYELQYDGSTWSTTFIATLSSEDSPDWDEGETVVPADTAFLTARVSPNGRYLAFMSQRNITGYDNEDLSSKKAGERLDQEVFLYDAGTQALICVSCNPTGTRPTGVHDQEAAGEGPGLLADRRKIWTGRWVAANIPGWTAQSINTALVQSRYLSDDGRLFFNSADALVDGVTVGTREEEIAGKAQDVGVMNVYEYEPTGVGACEGASGCIGLISSGTSPHESAFLEATPSGDDAFFITAAHLRPQDTDTAFDIYDARRCTPTSPCLVPPDAPPPPCSTNETCQQAQSASPETSTAGSATFSGPANLVPQIASEGAQITKPNTPATHKPLTRQQKLALALKACARRYPHAHKKRAACQSRARKRLMPKKGIRAR
jgi:hypothetical protein